MTNVSQVTVAEAYIKRDIPVIVTDGTVGWSAANLFSIPFLFQVSSSPYHLLTMFALLLFSFYFEEV